MVGIHAAFTCSDDTVAAAAELAERHQVGVNVHVGEGTDDLGAAARLAPLSRDNWLIIHGVHLADDHGVRGTLVHNPRSNMNNAVGYARPARFVQPVALGTDGIGADMLDEFRLAFVAARAADVTVSPDLAWSWLATGWQLMPDAVDDTVEWSYAPMDAWRLAYSTNVRARRVVVGDTVVLDNGVATLVDADEIRSKAAEQAVRLFARLS